MAKEAFVKYPENITFLTLKYYIEANVNQNAAAAQKVLKKYLKKNYRSTVQKLYATSFADRNMIPQFLSEYKKLTKLEKIVSKKVSFAPRITRNPSTPFKINTLNLYLTESCNSNCSYCFGSIGHV